MQFRLPSVSFAFLIIAFTLIGSPAVRAGEGVEGVWRLTVSTPRGVQHPTLTINRDGEQYSGTLVGRRGEQVIDSIAVEGNVFQFPLEVDMPIGRMNLLYRAAVEGDTFVGEIGNPRGAIPFSGERIKPAAE